MTRNPEDMDDALRPLYDAFMAEVKERGLPVILIGVLRTPEEHVALKAQGREPLFITNHLRKLAGMAPITEQENGYCVTWTDHSRHLPNLKGKSEAFDVAIKDPITGKLFNPKVDANLNSLNDWKELAIIADKVGLQAGYYFPKRDSGHFQLPK